MTKKERREKVLELKHDCRTAYKIEPSDTLATQIISVEDVLAQYDHVPMDIIDALMEGVRRYHKHIGYIVGSHNTEKNMKIMHTIFNDQAFEVWEELGISKYEIFSFIRDC